MKFNDYDEIGTYRIADDGKTVEAATPLYWKSTTQSGGITAWYTSPAASANGTIDLSNQTDGLAYVLYGTGTGSYDQSANLTFTHKLAKLRVVLNTNGYTAPINKWEVNNYLQCTYTPGGNVAGTTSGWIAMHQSETDSYVWEVNVVPTTITDRRNLIRMNEITAALSYIDEFKEGCIYTFNIDLTKEGVPELSGVDVEQWGEGGNDIPLETD